MIYIIFALWILLKMLLFNLHVSYKILLIFYQNSSKFINIIAAVRAMYITFGIFLNFQCFSICYFYKNEVMNYFL